MDALSRHDWPGNVRELENAVQRLVLLCDGPLIDVVDLPASLRFRASAGPRIDRTLAEVEAEHIALVVEAAGGNISKAAESLGIDRKTLSAKLKKPRTVN
jgi:two-component system response regulator HydG